MSRHTPAVCALEPEQGWGTESVPGSEVPALKGACGTTQAALMVSCSTEHELK